jgi:prepilin-type N-terminal cleavage/methylation domain-containing protein
MQTVIRCRSNARGYSAIEMMFVLGILGVLAGMAGLQMNSARPSLKGDGAMRVIMSQMRTARELAITQRRYMRVTFTAPNKIEVLREEVPGPSTTVVSSAVLEGGVEYGMVKDVPDTPDAFGGSTAINFGVVTNVKFTPDGTLVNQDGASANGSIFLAMPNVARSARAVTILGSTGRIRGYRWDGASWKLV